MPNSGYIVEVRNATKNYGSNCVLNDVSLFVRKGEFVTILGPSGCGKSTLLRVISGFETVSSGQIIISGRDMTATPPHLRPVNTVFQKYALFPHLNVYDNIAFGLRLKGMSEDEIDTEVVAALKMVGLNDYEERKITSLSGGQQQRVAIARAIANKPDVLLLDEPMAALDLKMRRDMQMEIKRMHKELGITFIYVTHDQEESLVLSDTVMIIDGGKIQQIDSPLDIYNHPMNSFVADFIGSSNILDAVMIEDYKVEIAGRVFETASLWFGENVPVDVMVRPEDITIFADGEQEAMVTGVVTTSTFKGSYVDMIVKTDGGFVFRVQSLNGFAVGDRVGLKTTPEKIRVMNKMQVCNKFDAVVVDETHIEMLGKRMEVKPIKGFKRGDLVTAEIDFADVELMDHESDGVFTGNVTYTLYKCDHYHLTVKSASGESFYVDTHDMWDKGDSVGLNIAPSGIRLVRREE